jgi:thioredoxin reductase (NADPH)
MIADAGGTAKHNAPLVRTADAAESPDTAGAYPRLSDEQVAALRRHGQRRAIRPGDVVIAEGDRDRDFTVVLAGRVAVYEGYGTDEQRLVAVHGPGRFLDEIGLLTGQPAFVSSVALQTGEVLTVPRSALRQLGSRDPRLGDLILRAFVCRREVLLATVAGIRIIGSRFSPDTRRLRELAARNRVPNTWIDLDGDPDAEALLRHLDVSPDQTPVVIWRGDRVLHNPDDAEFARLVGIPVQRTGDRLHDLVIVGAGPAGIAAAVYGASEGLATVVLDAIAPGGQAATASRIDNYPGFPVGVSGAELTDRAVVQARRFGAVIGVPAEAVGLHEGDGGHAVRLRDGGAITARAVVVATGTRYRRLDVPRLDEF